MSAGAGIARRTPALRIQLLSVLSLGLDLFGDASAAEQPAREAVRAARASGDRAGEVVALVPCAIHALARADWRQAIDLAGEAVARWPAKGMEAGLSLLRRGRR